jgi:hypothetical protein
MNSPDINPILQPENESEAPKSSLLTSTRARFWLGFGIGFLLLMLFSCGGSLLLFGPENFSLADLQGGQGAWTPPTTQPTAVQPDSAGAEEELSPQETAGIFYAGQRAQNVTNSRVNLRTTPGYQGKPAADVLAQLHPGDRVEIIGQSTPGDGLIWWQVRYQHPDGRVIEGWVAQATASGVTILAAVE